MSAPSRAANVRTNELRGVYKNKPFAPVTVDSDALLSNVISIQTQRGDSVSFFKNKSERQGNREIWIGHTADKTGELIVTREGGEIAASAHFRGIVISVHPIDGKSAVVVEETSEDYIPDHPPDYVESNYQQPTPVTPQREQPLSVSGPPRIDILVVANNNTFLGAQLANAIAGLNQSFVNSGVSASVEVVATMVLSPPINATTASAALTALRSRADVMGRMNASGADVAVFLTGLTEGVCGFAPVGPPASDAFAVVDYGCMTSQHSLSHEIGHVLGALHNREINPGGTFNHGWWHATSDVVTACFHTIMSYQAPYACRISPSPGGLLFISSPRINYWSNPSVNFNSVPTGNSTYANNVRLWNDRASSVAAFRDRSGEGAAARVRAAIAAIYSILFE